MRASSLRRGDSIYHGGKEWVLLGPIKVDDGGLIELRISHGDPDSVSYDEAVLGVSADERFFGRRGS